MVLMGDQLRLESVLTNFLTHAAKASTARSQIRVSINMKVGKPTWISGKTSTTPTATQRRQPLLDSNAAAAGAGGGAAGGGGRVAGSITGNTKVALLTLTDTI